MICKNRINTFLVVAQDRNLLLATSSWINIHVRDTLTVNCVEWNSKALSEGIQHIEANIIRVMCMTAAKVLLSTAYLSLWIVLHLNRK